MKKWKRYVPAITQFLLGVLNLLLYFFGAHNPFSLFASGLCFGMVPGMISIERIRNMVNEQINLYETHINSQSAYIEQLEKIINDVANGRANVTSRPIKSSQKPN